MAEARARRINHFKSEIFTDGPAPSQRRIHSLNSKRNDASQIFIPKEHASKPFSYSREKYFETSDIFKASKEQPIITEEPVHITDNTKMKVAGKKEKTHIIDTFFGNEPPHYYRKTLSKNVVVPEFQPKFSEFSVKQRKEKEFFGGFHPIERKKIEKPKEEERTARERLRNNLRSAFDGPANKENEPLCKDKSLKEYKPAIRKNEMLSSAVFQDKAIAEFPSTYKKPEYDEKRHKNHLYSDLLDTSYEFSEKKRGELVSSSQSWLFHTTKPNNIS